MNNFCRNSFSILHKPYQSYLFSSVGYKSALSLENLYPNSSLQLTTPSKPPNEGKDKFTGYIPVDELDITYSRSSGPGGQNVNKVNTKVEVRFKIETASWIAPDLRSKLSDKLKSRITKEGFAIFRSDLTRYQQLNLADCLNKIREAVRSCDVQETEITPETAEKLRRRHEKAVLQRLSFKRERSRVKTERQAPEV